MVEPAGHTGRGPGFELPERIAAAATAVAEATGAPVLAVGGAVRDGLLGLEPEDFDFACGAPPAAIAAALCGFGALDVVAELGRVALGIDGREVVFTTFRVEGDYGDDRRPRAVRFVDRAEDDAARRDFTVNAIYVPIDGSAVLDPCGGLADLAARRLRVIGDPLARLAEDPLRILRALRFEASRGLRPTAATAAALAACAPRCAALAAERRFDEVHRALGAAGAARAVERLLDLGALGFVLPGLGGAEHRIRTRALPLIAAAGTADEVGAWAALLGDPAGVERTLGALHAPRSLRREVAARLALAPAVADWECRPRAARLRLLRAADPAARDFARRLSDLGNRPAAARALAADLAALPLEPAPRLPSGDDVLALGVPAGPLVGAILAAVRARAEAGGIESPGALRALLADEVQRRVKDGRRTGR
jgi:tRNA nucleotidyltransferase/poly(A) polymerase